MAHPFLGGAATSFHDLPSDEFARHSSRPLPLSQQLHTHSVSALKAQTHPVGGFCIAAVAYGTRPAPHRHVLGAL